MWQPSLHPDPSMVLAAMGDWIFAVAFQLMALLVMAAQ